MSHKYKLEDFNIIKETDTDIHERIVSINLSNVRELPTIIVQRLEMLINKMIADHEKEHNITIPMDNAELGIYMDIDTQEHTLSLDAYVGYDLEKECITGKEVMTATDADYQVIIKFYFRQLNEMVFEQLKKIYGCVA